MEGEAARLVLFLHLVYASVGSKVCIACITKNRLADGGCSFMSSYLGVHLTYWDLNLSRHVCV